MDKFYRCLRLNCVRNSQNPPTPGGEHCGPLGIEVARPWETTSAVPGMPERIKVTASEIPSLATKVAKVGPRGEKKLAGLFIWEDTGPEKGRHLDGLAKNKLGKTGRRENKWSLWCVSKWLVNTFVWQTLCPIPAVYPIFWLKSVPIFCMSILSVLYMRCSSNFTSWWTGQGVLSYSKQSEYVSLKKRKRWDSYGKTYRLLSKGSSYCLWTLYHTRGWLLQGAWIIHFVFWD